MSWIKIWLLSTSPLVTTSLWSNKRKKLGRHVCMYQPKAYCLLFLIKKKIIFHSLHSSLRRSSHPANGNLQLCFWGLYYLKIVLFKYRSLFFLFGILLSIHNSAVTKWLRRVTYLGWCHSVPADRHVTSALFQYRNIRLIEICTQSLDILRIRCQLYSDIALLSPGEMMCMIMLFLNKSTM